MTRLQIVFASRKIDFERSKQIYLRKSFLTSPLYCGMYDVIFEKQSLKYLVFYLSTLFSRKEVKGMIEKQGNFQMFIPFPLPSAIILQA